MLPMIESKRSAAVSARVFSGVAAVFSQFWLTCSIMQCSMTGTEQEETGMLSMSCA